MARKTGFTRKLECFKLDKIRHYLGVQVSDSKPFKMLVDLDNHIMDLSISLDEALDMLDDNSRAYLLQKWERERNKKPIANESTMG